jgi:Arc/MetJ-type ribon-helix-helix transcriptional regulator
MEQEPTNKSGNAMVRLSPDIHNRIEALIQTGRFRTKTDFIRQAVNWYLNQEEYYQKLDTIVIQRITEGRYDEAINKRASKIK